MRRKGPPPCQGMRSEIGGGKEHPPCHGRRPQIGRGPPEHTIGLPEWWRDLYGGGLRKGNVSERGGWGQERVLSSEVSL